MKTRVFGIKTIKINNTPVHTINVIINSNPVIMSKIINDEFWKTRHTIHMNNSKSKITFLHTTMDMNEASVAAKSLIRILFAHKVSKLFNDNYILASNEKVNLINEVLAKELKPSTDYIW
jgi:hypothetical protein